MRTETGASAGADGSTSEERWAAWVARGVEHDRKIRTRARAMVRVVAGGFGLWLAIVLLLA